MTEPRLICFPFVGDDVGGSHISAARLIRELDPRRYRARIVLEVTDGPLARFLRDEGLRFEASPPGGSLIRGRPHAVLRRLVTVAVPRLRRFIIDSGAAIVHTNDGRIHTPWTLAARSAGVGALWHHRGDPDARGVNLVAPALAHRIVTVSRYARPSRPLGPFERKWSVIHSPFDHPPPPDRAQARAALEAETGAASGTKFIGYFGQFIERKRPSDMVDILVEIRRRRPDLPVMAVFFGADATGGPPLEEMTRRRAAERNVSELVRFMGFRRPIDPWMAAVDIHVTPAVNEPFGRTLIEAMLLGVPVVASDHGGNREAIRDGETGFLARPRDPAAFAEPIARLLSDDALRWRIIDAAMSEARGRYGAERHAAQIQALYDEMLGTRAGDPPTSVAMETV